ncbi:hypothetical protein FNF31_03182 [Cafeteria roenbergensis]|uniref:Stress-response A/B barrel domain-containing protein n=1 Tax=Cafeteria roenbergensis TaxID=33653 RepID=A0A5A8E182_CAFRO|nr:hypothetical protein FNF31_03182 [Cafeteria roenbergensis]KAA0170694.1 hypothetical protein FNF28_01238 [Cafeteria roenbergensis]
MSLIDHIVLFKWKPEATSAQIDRAMAALEGMVTKIDAIESLRVGPSITDRHNGWTHALVVRLRASNADEIMEGYSVHPAHLHVVENFLKGNAAKGVSGILADLTAVDISRPEVRSLPAAAAAVAEEAAFPVALALSAALAGAVIGFVASRAFARQ